MFAVGVFSPDCRSRSLLSIFPKGISDMSTFFYRTYLESTESAQVGAVFNANIGSTRTARRAVCVLGSLGNRRRRHLPCFVLFLCLTLIWLLSYVTGLKSCLRIFSAWKNLSARHSPSQVASASVVGCARFSFTLFFFFLLFGVSEPTSALLVVRDPSSFVWRAGRFMASSKWRSTQAY